MIKRILISVGLFLTVTYTVSTKNHREILSAERAHEISDSLIAQLAATQTSADSIRILYNIFDLAPSTEQSKWAELIYQSAWLHNRHDIALDALRLMANRVYHDSARLELLSQRVDMMPNTYDKRETKAYIKIAQARRLKDEPANGERMQNATKVLQQYFSGATTDPYELIVMYNQLAIYFYAISNYEQLNQYLDEAIKLADSLPSVSGALRNTTLTSMATLNLRNFDSERIIEANTRLLNLMEEISESSIYTGRPYRNFNNSRYTAMRRMLGHYRALELSTVDSLYNEIKKLADISDEVRNDMHDNPAAEGYYYMAHKEYDKALPLLTKAYKSHDPKYRTLTLLPMIIEAARATGKKDILLDYYPEYIEQLKQLVQNSRFERINVIESNRAMDQLREMNEDLKHTAATRNEIILIIIISVLLLGILAMFISLRRRRKFMQQLETANQNLTVESQNLLNAQQELIIERDKSAQASRNKTEFVTNMTHEITTPLEAIKEHSQLLTDCVDTKGKPYLERFAEIIKQNVDLVVNIVNDVLEIDRLEDNKITVKPLPCSLQTIVDTATGAIEHQIKPGVKLIIPDKLNKDITLTTDSHRVEQVLINLLHNAAKFTEQGTISLDYNYDKSKSQITFTITDTGIGIPAGKEKQIFARFEKLSQNSPGSGLGLAICASVAQLLGGKVWCEAGRQSGAKFFFRIPV